MRRISAAAAFLLIFTAGVSAEAVNENEMFSGNEMITQTDGMIPDAEEKKSIGFSGEITSVAEDIGISTSSKDSLQSYIVSNMFLDVRMKNGIKTFANLETNYQPETRTANFDLRELFFDFNLKRKIYMRTGKQVLQWGRCSLWNPSDLINIEKKTFIRKIGYREGAYGMKMHIPFGAKYNIYGFLDTGNAAAPEDIGGALKYEFLAGKTEMAFSGWAKRTYSTVFGYDFSSRISDVDVVGELSVSKGGNTNRLRVNNGTTLEVYRNNGEWTPRTSINFSKGFRFRNFNDRIIVSSEFFYNHSGYEENIFNDRAVYQFAEPAAAGTTVLTSGTKKEFLLLNGLYDMNYFSRYYGALFTSIGRFIIADMTLNVNYIRNFNDGSGILSSGVTYKNINDFSAGLLFNSFLGRDNTEYTFLNVEYDAQFTLGIAF